MSPKQKKPTSPAKAVKRGKAVNIWLHEEDVQRLDKLRAALSKTHLFASQSQVLRVCLRVTRPDQDFTSAFEHILAADGRRK